MRNGKMKNEKCENEKCEMGKWKRRNGNEKGETKMKKEKRK